MLFHHQMVREGCVVGKAMAEEWDKPGLCCMAHLAKRLSLRRALNGSTEAKHLRIALKLPTYNKYMKRSVFGMLTWNRVLIMILKPSEQSIHGGEDLAPVAESFWCHCHVLYPVRSSKCRRTQEMTGCFRDTPATIQHPHTNSSVRTDENYKLRRWPY